VRSPERCGPVIYLKEREEASVFMID